MSKDNPQDYKGNGEHDWEGVTYDESYEAGIMDCTERLRVPGGWLYRHTTSVFNEDKTEFSANVTMTFVPMPEVVKHKV